MCGIAGVFNRTGEPADQLLLTAMAAEMNRRGPDGEGYYIDGPFGLTHKRLSIIDLTTGAQPLFNEDKSIAAVVNGEIYNYHELKAELQSKGHTFVTKSDSECVLHLYEEYGTEFPSKLRGMFAIAIYDSRKKQFILATDRAGKKPIFYFFNRKVFVFASSMRALTAHPDMPKEIRLQSVWDYLSLLYIPAPDTIYQDVHKLRPGRLMIYSGSMEYPDILQWWKPDYTQKTSRSYREELPHLRETILDAVKCRLEADVPLGVFLSGGIDSTIIAAAAADQPATGPLQCFSIGFSDPAYNELDQAELNAEYIRSRAKRKIEFHTKTVHPDDFNILKMLCREYGEPFADSSIIPTYLLSEFARGSVTVALSGDGADEIFGGYERYVATGLLAMSDLAPRFLRSLLFHIFAMGFSPSEGERTRSARLYRLLKAAAERRGDRYFTIIDKFADPLKRSILGPAFNGARISSASRLFLNLRKDSFVTNPVERVMETDFHTYLPNDILVKADTASMAASLEVRQPFLDTKVMEEAATFPARWKVSGFRRKKILCDAMAGYYPPGLETARKRGFGTPLAAWMRGPWLDKLRSNLLEGNITGKYGLFNRTALEQMIRQHKEHEADYSYQLYSLLILELSLQNR